MIPWRETFSFCSLSVGFAALNPRLNKDDALSGITTLNRGRLPGCPYSYAQGRVLVWFINELITNTTSQSDVSTLRAKS